MQWRVSGVGSGTLSIQVPFLSISVLAKTLPDASSPPVTNTPDQNRTALGLNLGVPIDTCLFQTAVLDKR